MMATGRIKNTPQIGHRVWLGGEIVEVVEAIHGPARVTIKLDAYFTPVTVPWTAPDDESIIYCDGNEY